MIRRRVEDNMKVGPKHVAWAGALLFFAGLAWHLFNDSQVQGSGFAYEYGSPAWPYPPGPRSAARIGFVLVFVA